MTKLITYLLIAAIFFLTQLYYMLRIYRLKKWAPNKYDLQDDLLIIAINSAIWPFSIICGIWLVIGKIFGLEEDTK